MDFEAIYGLIYPYLKGFITIQSKIPSILQGLEFTLQCSLSSVCGGMIIGIPLGVIRVWRVPILGKLGEVYVSLFQGTPILVQLFIAHYALPQIISGYVPTAFQSVVITFSLNSAAYISEIIRAGINGVDKGQSDAAMALGLNRFQVMRYIIMPQALRNVLPALVNEIVDMLKETSVVSIIGGMDMLFRVKAVWNSDFIYLEPLLVVALVYYIMVMGIRLLARYIERRLN